MYEKFFVAAMGNANGFGNRSIATLINFFGSAKLAWSAEIYDLIRAGIKPTPLQAFLEFRKKFPDAPDEVADYCRKHKINLCSIFDEDYPSILKDIDSPPLYFYYRGRLQPHAKRIGIVGSRHSTPYGAATAVELGEQLAKTGFTIVSGAARGIDTFAHRGALTTGRTVAVLGYGLDYKCSKERGKFLAQIAERGVVLSELNPQLAPTRGTFAIRNRIIAGLCQGVIVVEACIKSGTMITANYTAKYERDIFAVDSNSEGCVKLIRYGAIPINNASDVVNKYIAKRL